MPIRSNYSYTLTQSYYEAAKIGKAENGTITHISYMINNSCTTSLPYSFNLKIYMRCTDDSSFPSSGYNWKQMSSSEKVYEGEVSFNVKNDWITIKLDTPFEYIANKNVLVCVQGTSVTAASGNVPFSRYSLTNGTLWYASNVSSYDIEATTGISKTKASYTPIIKFTFGGGGSTAPTDPVFSDIPSYYYPSNGDTGIFNPYFEFTATNKTHYKILLSTTNDFSDNVKYVAGGENEWVEDKNENVQTANYSDLIYSTATTYYWKVIAKNVKNDQESNTVESTVYSFTTKQISAAPDEIENATPNNVEIDDSNPKLEWEFAENTEDYQVVLDGVTKVDWTNKGTSTTGSYQTSNLGAGKHTWQVNTRNSAGTKTGAEYSFTVIGAPGKVTPIFPLDGATGIAEAKIKFRFAESTTHYRVFFATTDDTNPSHPYTFLQPLTNDWVATNGASEMEVNVPVTLTLNKKYYWTVEVKNGAGETKYFNYVQGKPIDWDLYGDPIKWEQIHTPQVEVYSFTSASTLPVTYAYPANNAVANEVNPVLSWNYQGSAAWYQVLFGTSKDNLVVVKDWTARGSNDSFQTTGLNVASQYYWQVNVKETENSEVLYGEIVSFITKLEVPQNVNANPTEVEPSIGEYGATQIMWNEINGANSYNVYLDGVMLANTARNSFNVEANTLKIKSQSALFLCI